MKKNYPVIERMFEDLILQTMQTHLKLHCVFSDLKDSNGDFLYYVQLPSFRFLLSSLQIIYIHEVFRKRFGDSDFITIAWQEVKNTVLYG